MSVSTVLTSFGSVEVITRKALGSKVNLDGGWVVRGMQNPTICAVAVPVLRTVFYFGPRAMSHIHSLISSGHLCWEKGQDSSYVQLDATDARNLCDRRLSFDELYDQNKILASIAEGLTPAPVSATPATTDDPDLIKGRRCSKDEPQMTISIPQLDNLRLISKDEVKVGDRFIVHVKVGRRVDQYLFKANRLNNSTLISECGMFSEDEPMFKYIEVVKVVKL